MGVKGKNTKSIRKKNFSSDRSPIVGAKGIRFWHQAVTGETGFDINDLTLPPALGLVNPSPTELAKLNLTALSDNLIITSNIRPFLTELSYDIFGTRIVFKNGFVPLDGEIFCCIFMNHVVNGTLVADVRAAGGSGSLLEAQTDYNLGEAIPINNLTNQFPIAVFRSGVPQARKAGNSSTGIGNYYMIDRGDGYSEVIRFEDSGDVGGETVLWSAFGGLAERPSMSTFQYMDKLAAQMDIIISDVAEATGNPTSRYQAVPNQSDLSAFGDLVYRILNVPVSIVEKQSMRGITGSSGGGTITNFASVVSVGDALLSYAAGVFTALKACNIVASIHASGVGANTGPAVVVDGVSYRTTNAAGGQESTSSVSTSLTIGQTFVFNGNVTGADFSVTAYASTNTPIRNLI